MAEGVEDLRVFAEELFDHQIIRGPGEIASFAQVHQFADHLVQGDLFPTLGREVRVDRQDLRGRQIGDFHRLMGPPGLLQHHPVGWEGPIGAGIHTADFDQRSVAQQGFQGRDIAFPLGAGSSDSKPFNGCGSLGCEDIDRITLILLTGALKALLGPVIGERDPGQVRVIVDVVTRWQLQGLDGLDIGESLNRLEQRACAVELGEESRFAVVVHRLAGEVD